MATPQEALLIALDHRDSGRTAEAEVLCRRILDAVPRYPDASYLLGVLLAQCGRLAEAVDHMRVAVADGSTNPGHHLHLAHALRAAGCLAEAAGHYRQTLSLSPEQPEALFFLAVTLEHLGDLDGAETAFTDTVRLRPRDAEARIRLARRLLARRAYAEAEPHLQAAQDIAPDQAGPHQLLGVALLHLRRDAEAVRAFREALHRAHDLADAAHDLGWLLEQQGHAADADAAHRRALMLAPAFVRSWQQRAGLRLAAADPAGARAAARRTVRLAPETPEAWNLLALAEKDEGRFEEAAAAAQAALCVAPALAAAWNTLGILRRQSAGPAAGLAAYARAAAADPGLDGPLINLAELELAEGLGEAAERHARQACALPAASVAAFTTLGIVRFALGRTQGAIAAYDEGLSRNPDTIKLRYNRSLALLRSGDWRRAWPEFEQGWHDTGGRHPRPNFAMPRWNGEALDGPLLVWGEQGVGDEVMFAGSIPDLVARGIVCRLDCDPRLVPLFARSFPGVAVAARGTAVGAAAHIPAGSLPGVLGLTADAAPRPAFLRPDPSAVADLRRRRADGRRVVGIAWRTKNRASTRQRSIDLAHLLRAVGRPGVTVVSLQYGDTADEIRTASAATGVPVAVDADVDAWNDLDRFAAQIAALDLVVSADTSTVHVAGALGVPVWTLLPHVADWRWLEERDTTVWYASMRLLRQQDPGDWAPVLARVAAGLA